MALKIPRTSVRKIGPFSFGWRWWNLRWQQRFGKIIMANGKRNESCKHDGPENVNHFRKCSLNRKAFFLWRRTNWHNSKDSKGVSCGIVCILAGGDNNAVEMKKGVFFLLPFWKLMSAERKKWIAASRLSGNGRSRLRLLRELAILARFSPSIIRINNRVISTPERRKWWGTNFLSLQTDQICKKTDRIYPDAYDLSKCQPVVWKIRGKIEYSSPLFYYCLGIPGSVLMMFGKVASHHNLHLIYRHPKPKMAGPKIYDRPLWGLIPNSSS